MPLVTEQLSLRAAGDEMESSASVKTRIFYRHYLHLVKILERSYSEVSYLSPVARSKLMTRTNRSVQRQ
jgi:hypothetical protein